MPKADRRMFLIEAYKLGMTEGDYVFYTVEMVPDENVLNPEDVWASNDGQNDIARKAFEAVFHVRRYVATSTNLGTYIPPKVRTQTPH